MLWNLALQLDGTKQSIHWRQLTATPSNRSLRPFLRISNSVYFKAVELNDMQRDLNIEGTKSTNFNDFTYKFRSAVIFALLQSYPSSALWQLWRFMLATPKRQRAIMRQRLRTFALESLFILQIPLNDWFIPFYQQIVLESNFHSLYIQADQFVFFYAHFQQKWQPFVI